MADEGEVKNVPYECPVPKCLNRFHNLSNMALHILGLAQYHLKLLGGKGLQQREYHYEWVISRGLSVKYGPIRNHLQSLFDRRQIREVPSWEEEARVVGKKRRTLEEIARGRGKRRTLEDIARGMKLESKG